MAKRAAAEPILLKKLRKHFQADPARLPVVEQKFAEYERANLQLALDEILGELSRQSELIGVLTFDQYRAATLAKLSRAQASRDFDEGPVEYVDVALPAERHLGCVKNGLYLVREDDQPLAVLFNEERHGMGPQIGVEVMATDREQAERFSRRLTSVTRHGKAFRGHTLSFQLDCYHRLQIEFHRLPPIRREDLILPEEILNRIERHTLSFNRHAEKLRAAGRHMKRGILLHGPPGTGKTLTAMYLAHQMAGRTVLLLTGGALGSIELACKLGRMLTPATIILEDADLIGTERHQQTVGANALLFELLNQMDGLAEDADILFLLTTNRPEELERALAARPGRIDQAIEIPPPDADCRRRLLQLYARGLHLELENESQFIDRLNGVSGSFIKELLRKAAIFAAEENGDGELIVRDRHLDEALGELLVAGGPLTQSLLGAAVPAHNKS
jgi:cell division protease FtsH